MGKEFFSLMLRKKSECWSQVKVNLLGYRHTFGGRREEKEKDIGRERQKIRNAGDIKKRAKRYKNETG